jgi:hypothetical protein
MINTIDSTVDGIEIVMSVRQKAAELYSQKLGFESKTGICRKRSYTVIGYMQMSKVITYYLKLIDYLYKTLKTILAQKKKKIKRILKRSMQDTRKYQKNMMQKLRV